MPFLAECRHSVSQLRPPFQFLVKLVVYGFVVGVLSLGAGIPLLVVFGDYLNYRDVKYSEMRIPAWIGAFLVVLGFMCVFMGLTLSGYMIRLVRWQEPPPGAERLEATPWKEGLMT